MSHVPCPMSHVSFPTLPTGQRTTEVLLGLSHPWGGGVVPACPALPSPCPLTPLVLSFPERPFCHHEGALHLRLLHVAGSAAPGHRHLLLLQVGLGAAPAPWAAGTRGKSQQGWLLLACPLLEQPGPTPATRKTGKPGEEWQCCPFLVSLSSSGFVDLPVLQIWAFQRYLGCSLVPEQP